MTRFLIFLIAGFAAMAAARAFAAESAFSRNLALGSRGEDVRALQQLLNQIPETRVAESGPGSPGRETEYFGSFTRNAVIKFQELYAGEILAPAGLARGTGFVGPSTRAKLNAQSETNRANPPILLAAYPLSGSPGAAVAISGTGFTSRDNTIYFGAVAIPGRESRAGSVVSFSVPQGIAPGSYEITVSNANGASNAISFRVPVVSGASVRIDSLAPQSGTFGTAITIKGAGFLREGNVVYTGYGDEAQRVSSDDGQTLFVVMNPAIERFDPKVPDIDATIDLWLSVENDNGISNGAPFFFLAK